MAEPISLPNKMEVPDGSQFNPGFLSSPIAATVRAGSGLVQGGAKLGVDTYTFGYDIGHSLGGTVNDGLNAFGYGIDPELWKSYGSSEYIGTDFWQVYNNLNDDIEYGDPQRHSGIQKGVATITPFVLSTRAAASKLAAWGPVANIVKNTGSFKSTLALNSAAGVYADMVHTRKADESMFKMLPESLRPATAQWFIDKDDDSEYMGRFKHAVEGMVLGGFVDVGFRSAGKMLDSMKSIFHQADIPLDKKILAADSILGDGDGSFTESYMKNNSVKGAMMSDADSLNRLDNITHRTGIEEEDFLIAKAKVERRARILSNGKKKGRQAKKAEKARKEAAEYTVREEATDLPFQNAVRSNIDETIIDTDRQFADTILRQNQQSKDIARMVMSDIKETDLNRQIAKEFLDVDIDNLHKFDSQLTPLEASNGMARVMKLVSGDIPSSGRSIPLGEQTFEAYKKLRTGALEKNITKEASDLKNFAADMGYSEEGLRKVVAQVNASGGSMTDMFVIAKTKRSDLAIDVKRAIKDLLSSDEITPKELYKILKSLAPLEQLDADIQGIASTSGRILRIHQESGDDLVKAAYDWASMSSEQKARAAASGVDVIEDSHTTFFKNLTNKITKGNDSEYRRMLKKIAKDADSPKKLYDSLNVPKFMDLYSEFKYSSLLSGIKTLASSVLLGNVTQTIVKSNMNPHFEAIFGAISKGVFNLDAGTSITRGLKANLVTVKTLSKIVGNFLSGDNRKSLENLLHLSSQSKREGFDGSIVTIKESLDKFNELAEHYTNTNQYAKRSLIELIKPMMAISTGAGNVMLRGIDNLDKITRGINNEVHLTLEADMLWNRDGGKNVFGSLMSKDDFMKAFRNHQEVYANISRSTDLKAAQKNKLILKQFGDNKALLNTVKETVDRAEKMGKEATLQQDPEGYLSDIMDTFGKSLDKTSAGKLFRLNVFPFVRTPMNALDEALRHSLAAPVTKRVRQAIISGTPRERVEAIAKMAAGTSIMGLGATLWSMDMLQGSIAPNDREAAKAAGIQENSIKVNGTWYSYEKLGSAAVWLSTISDYMSYTQEDSNTAYSLLFTQSLALAADESLYKSVRELLDVIELKGTEGEDKALRYTLNRGIRVLQPLEGMTGTAEDMHTLLTNGEKYKYRTKIDKEVGDTYSRFKFVLGEAIKGNTAWRIGAEATGAMEFDRELDLLGGEVTKTGGGIGDRFLNLVGISNKDHTTSKGMAWLYQTGNISQNAGGHTVPGSFGGVVISANQEKDLMRQLMHGRINMAATLDKLVEQPEFTSLGMTGKKEVLRQLLDYNKKFLQKRLFDSNVTLQRKDYIDGVIKLWKSNNSLAQPETEDEFFDDMIYQRKLRKDKSDILSKALEPITKPAADKYQKGVLNERLKDLSPILGDTTDER